MTWTPARVNPEAADLLLAAVDRIDLDDGLLDAAIAVALQIRPTEVKAEGVRGQLEALHERIQQRAASQNQTAIQAHLHGVLFDELDFHGNADDYDHCDNSNIDRVLQSHTGLPILLSLIYVLLARLLGLKAWGVGMPGHFLAGIQIDDDRQLIDPFHRGRILTDEDARQLHGRIMGRQAMWEDSHLEPVSHLAWVTRIINNLRYQAQAAGEVEALTGYTELLTILYPDDRDLADELSRMPSDLT